MGNTFNPSDCHADIALSNGNLTIGQSAIGAIAGRCYEFRSTGKYYVDFTVDAAGISSRLGIGNSSAPLTSYIGTDSNAWAFIYTGQKITGGSAAAYMASWSLNDVISLAFNLDDGEIYGAVNGTWGDSGDPATRTNPAYATLTGSLSIMASPRQTTAVYTMNCNSSLYLPAGYEPWDGGSLILPSSMFLVQ